MNYSWTAFLHPFSAIECYSHIFGHIFCTSQINKTFVRIFSEYGWSKWHKLTSVKSFIKPVNSIFIVRPIEYASIAQCSWSKLHSSLESCNNFSFCKQFCYLCWCVSQSLEIEIMFFKDI